MDEVEEQVFLVELPDADESEGVPDKSQCPARKPRKKVARRKLLKKKKERGTYKPKSLGACDLDVAGCIFSDEEIGAAYVENQQVLLSELQLAEDIVPLSDNYSDKSTSTTSTSGLASPASVESPNDSRPSSAAGCHADFSNTSRAEESCEIECSIEIPSDTPSSASSSLSSSRPGSRQSRHSVPSLSAACDMKLMLGASDPVSEVDPCIVNNNFIAKVIETFKDSLPSAWSSIAAHSCLHLFLLSPGKPKAIQGEIILNFNGTVSIFVHCECLLDSKILTLNPIPALDKEENIALFCENGLRIVKMVMNYDVCVGANHNSTRSAWHMICESYIDLNPYKEESYSKTCRSLTCHRLVKCEKSKKAPRCISCSLLYKSLKKRETTLTSETPSPFTKNIHLTLPQALNKINFQHEEIRKRDRRIAYLEKTVEGLLSKEGVDIEEEVSTDLSNILSNTKLTDIQKLFLEQQLKASNAKNPKCRRWHPTIIRLALHLRMTSASSYESLRDSGALILPSSRTLFDYSNAITPQIGVSDGILKRLQQKIDKKPKAYEKYCNLLCDEMYVSRNLVHRTSDNTLVGYQHLDEVEKEIANFEVYVENQFRGTSDKSEVPLAKTMLAFMVKGVCTDVKTVVAAFPMNSVTADNIYVRTWEVKFAAQVLSNTVANDIEQKKWPHTTETVRFIRYHNKFFDCLNGAYRDQAIRTKNNNLAPYTDPNDIRFSWLGVANPGHEQDHGDEMSYLDYIQSWKNQVKCMAISTKLKEKKKLSWQVMHGTETTIKAFSAAVRFLLSLSEPPQFILGRAFSQDPLEQHFSLQRAACGGSNNPNSAQFLGNLGRHAVQDELGTKRRNANVESTGQGLKITEEALPKRPRASTKKHKD
ncbi:tRNA (guanosine(18)-2'-O)-methyltransferase [Frankliniella fusca]|uniref:tRNA (Guanosine(18)-2'-O)-methyltransferase n=1 Tax=Frankliniella fusca TaxID=407009 RepID=A0AAE1H652_9NEOP|nr:tRNA (guanosine(18)-2'-O)-methyltransferase [Frankliniella fusca]